MDIKERKKLNKIKRFEMIGKEKERKGLFVLYIQGKLFSSDVLLANY